MIAAQFNRQNLPQNKQRAQKFAMQSIPDFFEFSKRFTSRAQGGERLSKNSQSRKVHERPSA
jgi:hypothetical protein